MTDDIKELVELYKTVRDFIVTIHDTKCQFRDLQHLVAIRPELEHNIKIIRFWATMRTDELIVDDVLSHDVGVTSGETDLPESMDDTTVEETNLDSKIKLTKDLVEVIAKYIGCHFDGSDTATVVDKVRDNYSQIEPRAIWRLVTKRTYANISDTFYAVDNGIVRSIK